MKYRFQYRLGSMLLLGSVFLVALGAWVQSAHVQREAVKTLEAHGFEVVFAYQSIEDWNIRPRWPIARNTAGLLDDHYISSVASVYQDGTIEDINDVAALCSLRRLRVAHLAFSHVNDEIVARLVAGCPNLINLNLGGTSITDDGVRHISSLGQLRSLYLYHTDITDDGVRHISSLGQLRSLALSVTEVTDTSCATLATLKRLEELNVSGTKISQSGVDRLRRALPRCSVLWQPAIVEEVIEEDPSEIEELDDLFSGPPGPNTNTSLMEGDELVKFFLDKDQRWESRRQAATRLRKTGRTKELWTALDDETEHIEVRRQCLLEISLAANRAVVDKMIAYVEHPEIGINAHEQLRKLTHAPLQDHGRADGRRDLALSWHRWWHMNRDTAVLDRAAVRIDH